MLNGRYAPFSFSPSPDQMFKKRKGKKMQKANDLNSLLGQWLSNLTAQHQAKHWAGGRG